jgi:spartin
LKGLCSVLLLEVPLLSPLSTFSAPEFLFSDRLHFTLAIMSAGHSEPQVLYSVHNIHAYSVQNGEEHPISTTPQTMSLLMVPTASPFADLSNVDPTSAAPEEDFYLHLHLPPELDLPLPATTQIYHKPPSSYLIPRWDLGPDAGAFIRIQFPSIGNGPGKVTQEEVDTFETILAQCTAFLERVQSTPAGFERYDPSNYRAGEGYVGSSKPEKDRTGQHGQIVLIDEENGSVIGELQDNYAVVEGSAVRPGSKSELWLSMKLFGTCTDDISSACTDSITV